LHYERAERLKQWNIADNMVVLDDALAARRARSSSRFENASQFRRMRQR